MRNKYSLWQRFKATFRLDLDLVCELSGDERFGDYHDYKDGDPPVPMHFYVYRCVRCGKAFMI